MADSTHKVEIEYASKGAEKVIRDAEAVAKNLQDLAKVKTAAQPATGGTARPSAALTKTYESTIQTLSRDAEAAYNVARSSDIRAAYAKLSQAQKAQFQITAQVAQSQLLSAEEMRRVSQGSGHSLTSLITGADNLFRMFERAGGLTTEAKTRIQNSMTEFAKGLGETKARGVVFDPTELVQKVTRGLATGVRGVPAGLLTANWIALEKELQQEIGKDLLQSLRAATITPSAALRQAAQYQGQIAGTSVYQPRGAAAPLPVISALAA